VNTGLFNRSVALDQKTFNLVYHKLQSELVHTPAGVGGEVLTKRSVLGRTCYVAPLDFLRGARFVLPFFNQKFSVALGARSPCKKDRSHWREDGEIGTAERASYLMLMNWNFGLALHRNRVALFWVTSRQRPCYSRNS